jgi:hypothetical protein
MSVYFRAFFNKRNSSVYTRWSTSWASDAISISLCGLARVRAVRYPCLKCGLGIRETRRYAAAEKDKTQVSAMNYTHHFKYRKFSEMCTINMDSEIHPNCIKSTLLTYFWTSNN